MSKERKFIVEYWYLSSWRTGESYTYKEIVVMATNEKEALRKAPFHARRNAKDFKIV